MGTVNSGVANSICMSYGRTITAGDVTDGFVEVDFNIDEIVDVVVQLKTDADVIDTAVALTVTKPSAGVVRVAGILVLNYTLTILGVRRKIVAQ